MYGLVAQLGERTVRIREVRGFDPLQVHHKTALKCFRFKAVFLFEKRNPAARMQYSVKIGKPAVYMDSRSHVFWGKEKTQDSGGGASLTKTRPSSTLATEPSAG